MTTKGQVRYSFPAWRVFVFGVEVTNDVISCNINWHDERSPGIAEFVLASERDRYVVTPSDIHALYDDIPASALMYEATYESNITRAINERIDRVVLDETKRSVLKKKVLERIKNEIQPPIHELEEERKAERKAQLLAALANEIGALTETRSFHSVLKKAFKGEVLRFPFTVGQSIFHTGDACRIFWRDPFKPTVWYFAATGSISDWREAGDANGRRTITLTVEDATRPFRMSRIGLNPAIYDVKVLTDPDFDDLIRNWHVDLFYNKTFAEMMTSITFGRVEPVTPVRPPRPLNQFRYGIHDKSQYKNVTPTATGVFNQKDSRAYVFGPEDKGTSKGIGIAYETIKTLEAWQELIDHQVVLNEDNLRTLCLPEKYDNVKDDLNKLINAGDVEGVITAIGSHPEIYPVDFGRLLMLLPASLGPGGNLQVFLQDVRNGIADQTETMTRLQIIYNACERLNFSFYATPRGDIVCEMPLYGFRPEDFGAYADRYRFALEDTISFESHFEHDKIRTLMLADYAILGGRLDTGLSSQIWRKPGTASRRALIPQFGMVAERAEPWSGNSSEQSASYYANIKLAQQNADAWVQNIQTVMHLGIGPNRPCWFEVRDFIATIRNVASAISWGSSGSVTQQLKLNYRRGWSGLLDTSHDHIYEPYGGHMADPLNYAVLFQKKAGGEASTSTKEASSDVSSRGSQIGGLSTDERHRRLALRTRVRLGDQLKQLYAEAIDRYDLSIPKEWANSEYIQKITAKEGSIGDFAYPGIPNEKSYGTRSRDPGQWDGIKAELMQGKLTGNPVLGKLKSSATGIGQLILDNVREHYPSKEAGIGDPHQEAIGQLRYIRQRYGKDENGNVDLAGAPARAWAHKVQRGWY